MSTTQRAESGSERALVCGRAGKHSYRACREESGI
jgi:hypothetical protein